MTKTCDNCGIVQSDMSFCSSCRKVYYCSQECQQQHWTTHCVACNLLRPLVQEQKNGYNDRMPIVSANTRQILYNYGQHYLSKDDCLGCVAVRRYPLKFQEAVQARISQTDSSAEMYVEGKHVYHFFILPLSSMRMNQTTTSLYQPSFVQFCSDSRTSQFYVPVVFARCQEKLQNQSAKKKLRHFCRNRDSLQNRFEIQSFCYFALTKNMDCQPYR